jgi:hypothetical protein
MAGRLNAKRSCGNEKRDGGVKNESAADLHGITLMARHASDVVAMLHVDAARVAGCRFGREAMRGQVAR